MKCYILSRDAKGNLQLLCQALLKGVLVEQLRTGPFETGQHGEKTLALARAILTHYFNNPTDPVALAEIKRRTLPFLDAFLLHATIPPDGKLEITGDVIDRFFSLQ